MSQVSSMLQGFSKLLVALSQEVEQLKANTYNNMPDVVNDDEIDKRIKVFFDTHMESEKQELMKELSLISYKLSEITSKTYLSKDDLNKEKSIIESSLMLKLEHFLSKTVKDRVELALANIITEIDSKLDQRLREIKDELATFISTKIYQEKSSDNIMKGLDLNGGIDIDSLASELSLLNEGHADEVNTNVDIQMKKKLKKKPATMPV